MRGLEYQIRVIDLLQPLLRSIPQLRVGLEAVRMPDTYEVFVSLPDLIP
jgi:hypothetical protein